MIVDPYGRIVAEGGINERGVVVGEVFTMPGRRPEPVEGQTLYTRWGDWFGWLMVAGMAFLLGVAVLNNRKGKK